MFLAYFQMHIQMTKSNDVVVMPDLKVATLVLIKLVLLINLFYGCIQQ